MEYRETPSSDPVDTFSASDLSLNGAVAVRLGRFDIGAGVKVIHEKIWLKSANGWAVDLGFNYHPHPSIVFAAAYLHSGPSATMNKTEYRLPRTWVFASKWNCELPFGTVSVSGQVIRPLDNRTRAGAGLEYSPVSSVSLRGGWKFNDDSGSFTAGAGITAKGWALDYAFVPGDYSLGSAHRFSISRTL
jgi:opacity protein-like surface antigen